MADRKDWQNPHLDGEPFLFPGNEIGVVLIHGYTATPAEMRRVGGYLAERGLTVLGPRLPGHGTTPADLAACRWQDWVGEVEAAYDTLRGRCRKVFVGGESLGGLLTLNLGATHPDVDGLIAFAPALYASNPLARFAGALQWLVKYLPKGYDPDGPQTVVDRRWQGYTVDVVPAVAELWRLQQRVIGLLPEIKAPLLIYQGQLDETIKPEGAQVVYDRVGSTDKELTWMARSTHCVALDVDWEASAEGTYRFIQRLAAG